MLLSGPSNSKTICAHILTCSAACAHIVPHLLCRGTRVSPGATLQVWHMSWERAHLGWVIHTHQLLHPVCGWHPAQLPGLWKGGSGGELEARVQATAAASLRLCWWEGRYLDVSASMQHGHPLPRWLRSPSAVGRVNSPARQHCNSACNPLSWGYSNLLSCLCRSCVPELSLACCWPHPIQGCKRGEHLEHQSPR